MRNNYPTGWVIIGDVSAYCENGIVMGGAICDANGNVRIVYPYKATRYGLMNCSGKVLLSTLRKGLQRGNWGWAR